ncbi:MAG TPA: hypothetical protein VLH94_03375 [Spirochaetia bacterium]|nr:hypothetical protein [Spirochaetia bacterium]
MKSILPIILIVLVLTGAIVYSLAKRSVPVKPIDNIGIPANELEGNSTITPTPSDTKKSGFGNLTVSPTPTITSVKPTVTVPEVAETSVTTKGGQTSTAKTTTTKTTICTPVYGSAETCTEHIVVDTGAESAMFFNFAGLAYLGGLASFVKAKSLKK